MAESFWDVDSLIILVDSSDSVYESVVHFVSCNIYILYIYCERPQCSCLQFLGHYRHYTDVHGYKCQQ